MMDFSVRAECLIEAEDLDDAFLVLALHFLKLARGEDSAAIVGGEISVRGNGTKSSES
jgi:hypothetical protein